MRRRSSRSPERLLQKIRNACDALEQLLVKYEFQPQADFLRELRLLDNSSEREEFLEQLAGGAVFGSAGSIADIELNSPGRQGDQQQVVADSRFLRGALVELGESLLALGFGDRALKQDIKAFRRSPHS